VWMVSAEVSPEELLAEVQTIAATAQEGKAAAAQCSAAALAAQTARATAEVAQAQAKQAMQAASAAARELLLAKRAEVEAEALVRKPATPDRKAGKGAKKGAPEAEVDPEAKQTEEAAAALLAAQAGQRCAEHLRHAEAASAEAQARAEEAAVASEAAAEACAEARRSAHDAAKSHEAEERAAEASEFSAPVSGPAGSEEGPVAQGERPLDADSAHFLHQLWTKTEAAYIRGAKLAFAGLRRLRVSVLERLHAAQVQFAAHLQRPDRRQAELTEFQVQFNSVDLDLLRLPEVKAELALQVLFQILLNGCDLCPVHMTP